MFCDVGVDQFLIPLKYFRRMLLVHLPDDVHKVTDYSIKRTDNLSKKGNGEFIIVCKNHMIGS